VFVRGFARASEARSTLSRANCSAVIPDPVAQIELEGHRCDSMILRTSSLVRVIQSPEIRHAPRDLAILRPRLSGQPRCWSRRVGVVTSGNVMAQIYSVLLASKTLAQGPDSPRDRAK